ncbi:MAG: hypothetical protein QM719_04340 [Thermomonas sp.]
MFEHQITHAQQMVDRLARCHEEGSENVPAGVPVTESEISTWYAGVYDAFVQNFGADSKEFDHFWNVRSDAQRHIDDWRTDLFDTDKPGSPPEPAFIRYLQTMIALLGSYADHQKRQKVDFRSSLNKGFLPWAAGIAAAVTAAGIAKWLGWV